MLVVLMAVQVRLEARGGPAKLDVSRSEAGEYRLTSNDKPAVTSWLKHHLWGDVGPAAQHLTL